MKITLFGEKDPIYVSDEQAEAIKQAIINGAEIVELGDELIKTKAIQSIRFGSEPAPVRQFMIGGVAKRREEPLLPEPKGDGHGRERYLEMRAKFFNTIDKH